MPARAGKCRWTSLAGTLRLTAQKQAGMVVPSQNCRLCAKAAVLHESHVVPAFVFRWMKETSATGFLRFGSEPNRRVQDGVKRYWLCCDCEQLLSGWEAKFASEIFHASELGSGPRVRYGDWMLKFCVSLSWRILTLFVEEISLTNLTEKQRIAVPLSLASWSDFMLGKSLHPGRFEQHLLPLGPISGFSGESVPTNINRYLLRAVDITVPASSDGAFVYCKFGRFVIMGFIEMAFPRQWIGTKIHVREGSVGQGKYTLPMTFKDFIFARCERIARHQELISPIQKAKIIERMRQDMECTANSGTFAALDADVEIFGDAAFDRYS